MRDEVTFCHIVFGLQVPDHLWHNHLITHLAWAYLRRGDAEKAIEYSQKSLEVFFDNSGFGVVDSLGSMENAYELMGKRDEFIS